MITENLCIRGASNTPAPNTEGERQRVLVDWVTASFYSEKSFEEILDIFDLSEMEVDGVFQPVVFEKKEGARYKYAGYNTTYLYNNLEFMYSEKEQKYLMNFSGQACREFEQISSLDYELLFGLLIGNLHANVSRIDIAIDDFNAIYRVNTIRKAVLNGQAVTQIRTWGTHNRGKVSDGSLIMDNFYLGTLDSRYSINVYDKKLEQESRGKEVTVTSWTRTELRLKEEYATRFARVIALSNGSNNIGTHIIEFLNKSVVFVKRKCTEKNKSRLAKDKENWAHWWKKYIGDVGKLSLSQKAPDKSVDRIVNWYFKQIAPSMAVLEEVDPEGYTYLLHKLTKEGHTRLNKTHELIIRQAKENSLTLEEVLDRLNKN